MRRVQPGMPPGTLVTTAAPAPPRITLISWSRSGATEDRVASVDEALAKVVPGNVTWINVDGLGDTKVLSRLGEHFGLHPLALEDVLNVGQRPKIERYDKNLFVVMRTIRIAEGEIVEEQVSLFLGAGWVITIQERPDGDCFGPVRDAIRQGRGRVREAGADYAAYLMIDAVVDAYFPVIEQLGDRMQNLESAAIDDPSPLVLVQMQRLRHQLLTLRRTVWPMREEVGILAREESDLVTPETRIFLRDVYDHAVQALEIVESLRETAVSVMEVYLSVQNQRLQEVMKVLTVIATIFIPLTFIASIYGMNFKHMPELEWEYGYAWALGLMAAMAAVMIGYFKKRGWW
ncbi:MAG TPA: magnesium/cobalt transporter CorA [Methylomirabilota bacterium]|nr:magnesium/cobalt transporter CorA [Methylomirabilota bacterium]